MKPQSGKSRKTKVISVRVDNKTHSKLTRKAGGRTKLTAHIKQVLTLYVA